MYIGKGPMFEPCLNYIIYSPPWKIGRKKYIDRYVLPLTENIKFKSIRQQPELIGKEKLIDDILLLIYATTSK